MRKYKTAGLFCAFVSFLLLILMGIQPHLHMTFVHRVSAGLYYSSGELMLSCNASEELIKCTFNFGK